MQKSYLKYYNSYSNFASINFLWDSFFADSRLKRLALLNRQKDYLSLANNPELLPIHKKLNERLLHLSQAWDSYDYGEGYFYQSLVKIGISGFRNTEQRIKAYQLAELLEGKNIFEIGCNTGFIAHSLADSVKSWVGVDINPHLISIAKDCANYLRQSHSIFYESSFENFQISKKFDAIISFANHSTYDGNTHYELFDYFKKCNELLNSNGLFLFESHPPEIEKEGLQGVRNIINELFNIVDEKVIDYGSFLDKNRTFIKAIK